VGAGDVKLAAATGLVVGYPDMLWVNLLILLAGGLLSITWAVLSGQLAQTLHNLNTGFTQLWLSRQHGPSAERTAFAVSATRMPYALAIGAGTAVHVLKLWPFS
jgi:prepilin peptidase CpaA